MNKRLFAIGDIHGCFDEFQALVEQKIQIKKSDQIILLGDYIDRGPHSKEVIDYIIDLQKSGFDMVPLLGNHEAMLLDAFYKNEQLSLWIQNGGSATLKSFGIRSLLNIAPSYIEFFSGLPYYFAHDEYLFVHAGFNDEISNPFEDLYHMIWECREKYRHPSLKDKTVFHGHRPVFAANCVKNVQRNDKVINLDTGCVYAHYPGYGTLTALEIYTKCFFFV
jgi:serine/threonine protein phosphatase 1